jgi:DNA polymerase III alpha subunit
LIFEIRERREVSVAGVVRSLIVKHTKSGSGIFGNLVLEDMKGSVEVMIFNDLLRKSLPLLEEKSELVIVKGTVEPSEERVRIKATEILSLKEMRNGSTLHISLTKDNASRDNFMQLKRMFESFPGESVIYLHLETMHGEVVVEIGDCRVDIQDKFIADVERLLGNNVLRYGFDNRTNPRI